jgi:uncharacterized protein DUF2283
MADKVRVWFDAEGDFLEVRFSDAAGYMKETAHDAVMERVDAHGQVIGFSIMQVSRLAREKPLVADLLPAPADWVLQDPPQPYRTSNEKGD